ncbi:MAG: PQQ-dependent sugar dehydrogenase [Burkholderiales bacterium]|nr:PQQ-dependent sugar dehydrogenase [Burkholderiales bacterium]
MIRSRPLPAAVALIAVLVASGTHAACNLDIDQDGAWNPGTDGVLIVRRLIGLSGAALVADAVNPRGMRTDAAQIASHIDSMIADRSLRLDGSGNAPTATGDGLMVVRAMQGATGPGVLSGAITGSPPRNTWALLRSHLNGSCGGALASDATGPLTVTPLPVTLNAPWGMAFLPDGRMLFTQKGGSMVIVSANGASKSANINPGLPNLSASGQGGLLDVALDPDYDGSSNTRIYWTFSETGSGGSGTAVARGDLNVAANTISNAQVIYRQTPKVGGDGHFGSRLAFRSDKTLMVTLGERQTDDPGAPTSDNAQNLTKTLGKVIRINRDGTIPADNPTFAAPGARPEIWSYGHRNPQGAAMRPGSDDLWVTEHGPLGGDELNFVLPGRNYGWPLVSYGCPYWAGTNTPSCRPGGTGGVHVPTYEEPVTTWLPVSTAPSGLVFYTGGKFDDLGWQGNAFVGGLAGTTLWRIVLNGNAFVSKEEVAVVKALGQRMRVVKQGPDGWLYLATDGGQLLRLWR